MSSSHNLKEDEESCPLDDEALQKANDYIKELFGILKHETSKVRKEKEDFDEKVKKLEHVHFSKMLKLNVGGHLFTTSLETITKDPGSMLHTMFSGRFDTKPSEDGSYFIDRDGTHFRYILNYLRTGQLMVHEEELDRIHKELLAEAEFYQIEGIINELTGKSYKPFENSVIMSPDECQTLTNWLKIPALTDTNGSLCPVLFYRASRDGWEACSFHGLCDKKGPTVTVIKSGNYIFGGYTDEPWESPESGSYKKTPNSFLFSLVNPSGLPPTKMPLIAGKEDHAIICNRNFGPLFGSGNDLRIVNGPNFNNCYASLNNTYQCPANQDATRFLTGNQNFTLREMEVFGFEK